jgi:ADP-ribose pyrophosphatase
MKRPIPKKVKIFSDTSVKVFEGIRFSVYQWQQKLFDGSFTTYETIKRNDTVVILGYDGEHIILVNERQPHWDYFIVAAPGGIVDEGEDIEHAARREMEEETGCIFDTYVLVDVSFPTPGVEWGRYIFIATNLLSINEKRLDRAEEQNSIIKVTINRLIEMIRNDELHYPLPFLEKLLLKNKEAEIFDMFSNPEKYEMSGEIM